MKCPKCGEELKQGYLYCEKCGEEIRIVPDFEPEIENSIIETLSAVVEEIALKVESEYGEDVQEDDKTTDFVDDSTQGFGRIIVTTIVLVIVFIGMFGMLIFSRVGSKKDNSDSLLTMAQKEYEQKNYEEAASYYERLLKKVKTAEIMVSYADCLYEIGELDRALSNYYAAIDLEPDNEMAYARIIAMYESQKNYEEIYQFLKESNNEQIQNTFKHYMTFNPSFSVAEGTYKKVIPLKITSDATGDLYYTTDGTDPMTNGTLYKTPIFLRGGEYHVKAVYINDYGICSDIVEAKYTIESILPQAPEPSLESGIYTTPQKIHVSVPEDCVVYYSTDGSDPDENSFIYGEPIPMKEGVTNYRFVSLDKDGVYSEIVARSYQLSVETALSAADSVSRLKHRLLQKEILLDLDGSIPDMNGKNIYVYDSLQVVENKIVHVINEYYQEGNSLRNMTGKVYCIDVSNGYVYRIVKDESGNEVLDPV